jgi:hypothetical protein
MLSRKQAASRPRPPLPSAASGSRAARSSSVRACGRTPAGGGPVQVQRGQRVAQACGRSGIPSTGSTPGAPWPRGRRCRRPPSGATARRGRPGTRPHQVDRAGLGRGHAHVVQQVPLHAGGQGVGGGAGCGGGVHGGPVLVGRRGWRQVAVQAAGAPTGWQHYSCLAPREFGGEAWHHPSCNHVVAGNSGPAMRQWLQETCKHGQQ